MQHASIRRLGILMTLLDPLSVLRNASRIHKRVRQLQFRIQKLDTELVRPRNRIGRIHGRILSPLPESRLNRAWIFAGVVLLVFAPVLAHAQGCSQCLDTTRATPPAVQAAYRHAILLLLGGASALFIAGVLFIRREP